MAFHHEDFQIGFLIIAERGPACGSCGNPSTALPHPTFEMRFVKCKDPVRHVRLVTQVIAQVVVEDRGVGGRIAALAGSYSPLPADLGY
jgi:hypothetical protein